jgi:hypothetical protein
MARLVREVFMHPGPHEAPVRESARRRWRRRAAVAAGTFLTAAGMAALALPAHAHAAGTTIAEAAAAAQQRFGVPAALLEAICYFEGQLSDHGGAPSSDGGYGCVDLARNSHLDTLDQAAHLLGVPVSSIRASQPLDIAGAAAVLRADAISLSATHQVPLTLGGWYGAIAKYSGAQQDVAVRYADEVYRILQRGLTATAPTGETVRIAPTAVIPGTATARNVTTALTRPADCTSNPGTGYPSAYNCIVPTSYAGVTYDTASRPTSLPVLALTIHDTEETLDDTIATFWNESNGVSIQYVVDTDGTVYQCLHEKDVAFHNGNFWYNQRTVGIENVGVDAAGYQWYNATEYLGSAVLAAYLLNKYGIPLTQPRGPGPVLAVGLLPGPDQPAGRTVRHRQHAVRRDPIQPLLRPAARWFRRHGDHGQRQLLLPLHPAVDSIRRAAVRKPR